MCLRSTTSQAKSMLQTVSLDDGFHSLLYYCTVPQQLQCRNENKRRKLFRSLWVALNCHCDVLLMETADRWRIHRQGLILSSPTPQLEKNTGSERWKPGKLTTVSLMLSFPRLDGDTKNCSKSAFYKGTDVNSSESRHFCFFPIHLPSRIWHHLSPTMSPV